MKKLDFPHWRNDIWATEGYYALCRRVLVVLAIGAIVLAYGREIVSALDYIGRLLWT